MKKIAVSWLILIPILAFSQKPTFFKTTKDRFTAEVTTRMADPITIRTASSFIMIDLLRSSKYSATLAIYVKSASFGCTSQSHMVRFLFSDSSAMSAYNSAEGCNGSVLIFLTQGPTMNQWLATKLQSDRIAAVRISTDDQDFEFDLSAGLSKKLQHAAIEFFTGSDNLAIGAPIDSNARVPKRSAVQAPRKVE